jgi:hypothetical protein
VEMISATAIFRTSATNHTEWFKPRDELGNAGKRSSTILYNRKYTHAAVGIAMAAATFRFMQATTKTAMRRVLGIRGGQGEMLVPPTAVAVAGGDEGFVFEFEASDSEIFNGFVFKSLTSHGATRLSSCSP